MKTKHKEKIAEIVLACLFLCIGVLLFLFIKGDLKVFLIETDASLETQSQSLTFINVSQFGEPAQVSEVANLQFQKSDNIVFFSSSWCGQCELLRNEIRSTLLQYNQDEIALYEAGIDQYRNLATKYGISNTPALLHFDSEMNLTTVEDIKVQNVSTVIASLLR